jgi:hypothetical protein
MSSGTTTKESPAIKASIAFAVMKSDGTLSTEE